MEIPLLKDVVIVFGLSVAVILSCHRLRIPTIAGFLITGVLVGPHGFRLVGAAHEVDVMAEIGVVFLLFTIGMEFSLREFLRVRRAALLGGGLQVGLTVGGTALVALGLGLSHQLAVFMGFLVALSSTAIVLKLLQDQAQVDSPHGRTSLAILIFQDIAVVPMMLLVPALAGVEASVAGGLLMMGVKGLAIVGLALVSAKWVVPFLLFQITRTRSRELFVFGVLLICLSVAWLTHAAGLSLALGAFLAGLVISESEYSHQTIGNVLPFRDVFTSFFFISIGMLLDVRYLAGDPWRIALVLAATLLLKGFLAGLTALALSFPIRTAVMVGMTLSQVGEFSFILSKVGLHQGLLPREIYQVFLAVAVLSMGATPFILSLAPRAADLTARILGPVSRRHDRSGRQEPLSDGGAGPLADHLIVIGFGLNGRNVTRAAKAAGIPYVIVEMNPETVRSERRRGERIQYGDASQEAVLQHTGVTRARAMVIVISDPAATRRVTAVARQLNPALHIIARTRFLPEMKPLMELGADEVIPEEFETAVEIFARVLRTYLVPRDEIEQMVREVRSDGYEMFRGSSPRGVTVCGLEQYLPGMDIRTYRVAQGAPAANRSLAELALRKRWGVTVLAVGRGPRIIPNPEPDTVLEGADVALVMGSPEQVRGVQPLFHGASQEARP